MRRLSGMRTVEQECGEDEDEKDAMVGKKQIDSVKCSTDIYIYNKYVRVLRWVFEYGRLANGFAIRYEGSMIQASPIALRRSATSWKVDLLGPVSTTEGFEA